MAKTKTPFFGLASQGSVGESITTQRRGRDTVLRRLPVPTDPYTLPQAYQRWLYQDYVYLWTLQSLATKQQYAALGSRRHLTAFQYWMKYQLTNLPDMLGWWKLDDNLGPTTVDSSRNSNTGTITGAVPADGAIGPALYFDGLNNIVSCGADPTLHPDGDLTAMCLFATTRIDPWQHIIGNRNTSPNWYGFTIYTRNVTGALSFYVYSPAGNIGIHSAISLSDGLFHHVALVRSGALWSLYLDGAFAIAGTLAGAISAEGAFTIGFHDNNVWPFIGTIDNVILKNRALDITEIARSAARRYPP